MVDATPCGRNRQCLLVDDDDTFLCGDPCVMTSRRIVGIGEACDPRNQIVCDEAEATCGASGTCEPLPSAGEPCDGTDCDRDAYCDDTDTCVPAHPRGESCTDGFECETATCDMGVCQPGCQLQPF
jgi:hypothetical protein